MAAAANTNAVAALLATEAEALEAARRAASLIAVIAADRAREAEPPREQLDILSRLGVTGIGVPKEHGGLGARVSTIVETVRLVSGADGSVGQILQLHNVMVRGLFGARPPEVKRELAADLLAGKRIGHAMAEIGGKNKFAMTTTLRKDADGRHRLNGRKFYTTGCFLADWISVGAVGEEGQPAGALVRRDAPGVTVLDDWRAFGQRNTLSGTAIFENVEIDERYLSPRGAPRRTGLTFPQILHAAIDVGIAGGALQAIVGFLRDTARAWVESGVERASQEPYTIAQVGEFVVSLRTAEAALKHAAAAFDFHDEHPDDDQAATELILSVATARAAADRAALEISSEGFALLGASSTREERNLDRFWRNARVHTTHDPIRWRKHHLGNYYLNGIEPSEYVGPKKKEPGNKP